MMGDDFVPAMFYVRPSWQPPQPSSCQYIVASVFPRSCLNFSRGRENKTEKKKNPSAAFMSCGLQDEQ